MAQDRIIKIELGLTRIETGRPTTAVLELETGKGFRKGCRAHATVFWIGNGFKTHALFSDFSKTVATLGGNATQANIDKLHGIAFNPQAVEIITGQAKAFYTEKDVARSKYIENEAAKSHPEECTSENDPFLASLPI